MTGRLIQQALLQVLQVLQVVQALQVPQALIDPTFSEHSHGFRPSRRARDAVLAAQQHVQDRLRAVIDVDLSKLFGRVTASITTS